MNDLWGLVNRLGMARVAAMAVVAVLIMGFFVFLILRATSAPMAPLYSGLGLEDSAAIVAELRSANIPYELRGDGDTILVPRDRITALRMELAGDGLPTRGQVGYEIFDTQSTLGATSFVQNINQVRALEGELARTIASLARIRTARVHLVLPERELFSRERQEPSASIMLAIRGELSAGEIRAIQHLVASAITGMGPNAVSIVDDSGRLLASGAGSDDVSALAGQIEERTLGVESRLRTRLEEMLANVVGPGRARVQVAAELDLDRATRTAEIYDPDGQVVRSTQLRELASNANGPGNDGSVTVANALPGAEENAGMSGGMSEESATSEETVNYEISRTTETRTTEAGGIRRLSVAVVVDGVYTQDANGNATYQARSEEEIEQIATLVRSAVGFDAGRGDLVEVVNMQFAERPAPTSLGTAGPGLFDFTRDDLFGFAEMAVTLLIALALVFFVMRPLVRRVLEPEAAPLALPPTDAAPEPVEGESVPLAVAQPEWVDHAKSMGEAQMKTLSTVGELVGENPKQATLIVRDWLNSDNRAA